MTADLGVVVVTGGSRGIGAAVCRQAAARGYRVVINYASDERAAASVLADVEAAGGSGITVAGDVADESDVRRMFDAAAELGPLTGLVSNAAITGNTPGRLDEQDVATVRRVLDVNVVGVFLTDREAVRRMSTRHGGRGGVIVNISSTAAGRGSPGEWVHYAASKVAVQLRVLRHEGLTVRAVEAAVA